MTMSLTLGNFMEPLGSEDNFSKISFSLNRHLLRKDYEGGSSLIHQFSFGEITLSILRMIYLCGSTKNFSVESEIRDSIDYIANELLENSIKYSDVKASKINLEIRVSKKSIVVISKNLIDEDSYKAFLGYIKKVGDSDPSKLYIEQLEKNINDDYTSGLGLLSIIHDYQAKVSWKFDFTDCKHRVLCYVVAQLPLEST